VEAEDVKKDPKEISKEDLKEDAKEQWNSESVDPSPPSSSTALAAVC
jgi:hypothetical protein